MKTRPAIGSRVNTMPMATRPGMKTQTALGSRMNTMPMAKRPVMKTQPAIGARVNTMPMATRPGGKTQTDIGSRRNTMQLANWFTESHRGIKFDNRPKTIELTLDEIAAKFGMPVGQLKIKK